MFGAGGERLLIAAEKPEHVAYRKKYMRRRMDDREGPLTAEEIAHVNALLTAEEPPARSKGVIESLRKTGKFKRPWASIDESYVCENFVGDATLYEPGQPINRREGAGKRLCMGGAGLF